MGIIEKTLGVNVFTEGVKALGSSTALEDFDYDVATSTLTVEFKTGGIYQYSNVPPQVFTTLLTTISRGQYFNSNIRNVYQATRVG